MLDMVGKLTTAFLFVLAAAFLWLGGWRALGSFVRGGPVPAFIALVTTGVLIWAVVQAPHAPKLAKDTVAEIQSQTSTSIDTGLAPPLQLKRTPAPTSVEHRRAA